MKKWLIGIFIFLAAVVVIVVVAFQATKGVARSANDFFALIQTGKLEGAYSSTAKEFQASTSLDTFRQFLEMTTLGQFSRASWSSRSINNNTGKLVGSIHTREGGVVPVEIDLVKENGKWKILSLTRKASGLQEKQAEQPPVATELAGGKEIPSADILTAMINGSVWLLGDGINKNDLSAFYDHVARLWQSQTDEASLRQAFQQFIDRRIDLTIIQGQTPVLSEPPVIDEDGVLRLKGYYPTQPYVVNFELGYIYEHPQWKLVAININTK